MFKNYYDNISKHIKLAYRAGAVASQGLMGNLQSTV